jgi:signal transduction histidine kinase
LITADRAHDVGNALAPWLATAGFGSPSSIPHPLGSGMVRLVIIPIGYDGGRGVIAVASQRADFPTELDHLLLNVGVNQAAIALQEAQLLADLRATNQLKDRLLAREQAARSAAAQAAQIAQQRARQLRELANASLAIKAALSLDIVLQIIAEQAQAIIGAHQAVASITVDDNSAKAITIVVLSDKYDAWRNYNAKPDGSGIYSMIGRTNLPARMTQAELEAHHAWRNYSLEAGKHPPLRGLLAAPLIERSDRNIGLLQLSDKYAGEFTADDEAVLVQLAELASVAIENARLYNKAQEAIHVRDQFLTIASHELKTPLTSLLGQAQLLERRAKREDTFTDRDQRTVQVIVEQAYRLNTMIMTLLDISRIETGQLSIDSSPLNLSVLVRRVVVEVQPTLDRHTVECVAPNIPLMIEGDALRLEQVIQNLVQNAIKYSPAGGTVHVQLEQRGTLACMAVQDEGIGIPLAALPQLFQRFYRAKNVDEQHISGMGIGLYIVEEIVSLHGGTVDVQSTEGKGSIFTICLPLLEESIVSPVPPDGEHA